MNHVNINLSEFSISICPQVSHPASLDIGQMSIRSKMSGGSCGSGPTREDQQQLAHSNVMVTITANVCATVVFSWGRLPQKGRAMEVMGWEAGTVPPVDGGNRGQERSEIIKEP